MIQTVVSSAMPVDEILEIKKNRYTPEDPAKDAGKRICVCTGIHGDELEGQYVCYEVGRRIKEHPEYLTGTVDVYPALNPFGIDTVTRGIPAFDLDMNRIFPGRTDGEMYEYVAAKIIEDLTGADLCFDIHASNIYLTEVPQIRINELHQDFLIPLAEKANVDFIWVHGASTVLEATLAHSMNSRGVPTLVVEMGVGMRITRELGDQLTEGIFSLMAEMGVWQGPVKEPRTAVISSEPDDVTFLNAATSGMFMKALDAGSLLHKGELIGTVIDPLDGSVLEEVRAEEEGWLFTIREYPMVLEGSLMGRILKKETYNKYRGK